MCKKKEVPFSILDKLVLMVKHCEEGNFLAANDQYIRTAIGNAAWPIGELVQYIAVGAVVDSTHVMCVDLSLISILYYYYYYLDYYYYFY